MHKYFFPVHNIHLFSAQMYFWVHKYISQSTNVFLSAQIYFSVHKSISQCTNVFLSVQIYFSVHKCISQCLVTWFSRAFLLLGWEILLCLANRSAFENILIPHRKACFVLAVALKCKFPFHFVLVVAGALKVIMTQIAFHVWRTSVGRLLLSTPRVHNRSSQIPLSRLFFFSIPLSRPILRPNPDPVPFFYEIFCLLNRRYIRLPSNNCQFWWSRFSTSQLAAVTLFSVLLIFSSAHRYMFIRYFQSCIFGVR